jgi:hypothetical protein
MKKLLFFMLLAFGGAMFLKGGYVSVTPDNQVHVAGWIVPLPASVQNSPVMGMLTMMARMQTAPPANADPRYAAAPRPAVPVVTSAASTYNANAPATGPAQGGDQFSAVSKALRGQ